MFRVPFLVALALTIAFGGGIALTRYAIAHSSGFGAIQIGAWEAYPKAQTTEADPYAKSHRAKSGELLLGSAEGLIFYASSDDEGHSLNPTCLYHISGTIPQARFWTLTATDTRNQPLIPRPGLPSALNNETVLYAADGRVDILVSPDAQAGNWLAAPRGRPFHLALTLYDTPVAGSSGLLDLTMPEIRKEGCGNA